MVLQAYKSHGFSKEFLQRIEKNYEKRKGEALRIEKIFTKIFDKEPTKKVKKIKKKEEPEPELKDDDVVEPIEDEDQPPKSDEPEEEETLDVEPDEDEEEVEEEYVSDGE